MGKIAEEETIGRPLSRAEALKIAQQILECAEQERLFLTLGELKMETVIVTDGERSEVWERYRKGEEIPPRAPQAPQVQTAQGGPVPVVTPQVWPGVPDDWRE